MPQAQEQAPLLSVPDAPRGVVVVNDRCVVRTQEAHRVVVVSGIVLAQYALGDRMAEAHAMVYLIEQGWADQNDVARAFGCTTRTVRRFQRRFETGGLAALGHKDGCPKGHQRLGKARTRLVSRLKAQGCSNRDIARHVGVSENAVRKLLRRLGWRREPTPIHARLPFDQPGADPNLSAFSTPRGEASTPRSRDTDPSDRRFDRLLAALGLLEDASPMFRPGARVPQAGVLLALPPLIESGVFDCAQETYGSIGPAFYGLRTTLVVLLLMALLRIKRPEALKEHPPEDLGRLLGLDRAPEVKTLRRTLSRLAKLGRAAQFGRALAQRRVAQHGAALGFLYVDGHVRVYHGKHVLPKAHVSRLRISMPATSDYWVNDASGDPLFVVTAEANDALARMLPGVLTEVRSLVGERRTTIVFDRGGWSPKLFQTLIAQGFDLLTYRKGRFRKLPRHRFRTHHALIDGREVTYSLADQGIALLGGALRLRQVTRLSEDGHHQTPIITSRRDLLAAEVAQRMFDRWRQENFFKYLKEEFALDALIGYEIVPADPTREVPNPVWKSLTEKLRRERTHLALTLAEYGLDAFDNLESARKTMRGFKIAHSRVGRSVEAAFGRIARLEAKRALVPKRVPVQDVVSGEVVKLAPERKHLTNLIKMVAYQAESDLVRRVAPHYKRAEHEGRTLIQSTLASAADIELTDRQLLVRIAPLSSAHRTRAIAALCDDLNQTLALFPGSHLRLRYAVCPLP